MKLAITGKGGVGKTTLASTLARLYADEGRTVLAADVDPDANLGLALGLSQEEVDSIVPISKMRTLVEERTGATDANRFYKLNPYVADIPEKYSKDINGVKLLVMGTVDVGGSGCVCPEHVMLKSILAALTFRKDDVVIMDMEAGLEHLGRGTASNMDQFIVVIEPGARSVQTYRNVKRLAQDLFHSPESLIRLDMSEFMEKHSVSRIVGSPPGYVGYDEAGQLTEKIRRKPYSVVLFDEIEKAHPDVLNVLLQILDDGQITDAHGRKVNFENTVIVMTSNAGSDSKSAGAVGFGGSADDQGKERIMKALQDFLRPEFLNRVDEIVCFNHLTKENFCGIARIMLEELKASLGEKGYQFRYDDALVDYLAEKSYSLTYGARNLRRLIQKELEDPMAAKIIDAFEHPITQIGATAKDGAVQLYTL